MSDAKEMARQFLEKRGQAAVRGDVQPINSFRSLFAVKELTVAEKKELASLLHPNEHFERDLAQLTQITAELKSIQKQAVVLIGERISRAREILKSYGDQRAFTAWMDATFQSRKTAYNALAFYDLYHSLSNDLLRDQLKRMPMKASYILASRPAPQQLKEELIEQYEGEKQIEMIELIQQKIPTRDQDQRGRGDIKMRCLKEIEGKLSFLEEHKEDLSSSDSSKIKRLIQRLSALLT